MNRRAFLATLATAAAGLALDPERLLWVPGAKTIFMPAEKPSLVSSCALKRGDVITLSGVFAVNPMTGEEQPYTQQFVITSDVSYGDVPVSLLCPRPIDAGPYRNVNRFSGRHAVQPLFTGKEIPIAVEWSMPA